MNFNSVNSTKTEGNKMRNIVTVAVACMGGRSGRQHKCDCGQPATTKYASGWSCQPCADMCLRVAKELDNLNRRQNPAGERRRREEAWQVEEMAFA